MKVGIVIAIAQELKSFLSAGYEVEVLNDTKREVFKTNIAGKEVYAIRSGAGQIDAASATQLLITKYDCDVILNFGVTGAIVKGLKVEDLFIAIKACNYDYDTSEVDQIAKHRYIEFEDMYIPLDKGLIDKAKEIEPSLKEAFVASGDRFVSIEDDKDFLNNETLCNICDMELAAIARTCYLNDVKCLSIKCISDTYEGGAGEYQDNVSRSADKAFKLLAKLINELN